uniref:probable protein S-acyltransferase 23 isoform X1 n=1 Tax=Ciona intestinalis TaxID=7719 RepID=UPI0000521F34|nr:probable protein S-acyltransferase 23 isoform X1 [Ciona intestinalis]|eukprot:XP_026696424.1 probable protein S-acyltransferase 23 isoform X1 [Ciona intestinalis]
MASAVTSKGYTAISTNDEDIQEKDGVEQNNELSPEMDEAAKEQMRLVQDIFHVSKLGLLIPVQDIIDRDGIGVLSQYDKDGHSPIHWACLGGHNHVVRYFAQIKAPLDIVANNQLGAQPIHWACVNGHVSTVDILLQAGISIDSVDNKGCTPLIIASQYGRTMLAGFLMGKGARLQITDKEGDNALMWAAFKGKCELTRLLIYSGFNPKQKDNFGQTSLHLASLSGDLLTVQLLCEQDGVDINLEDHNGNTPLKLAKGRKYKEILSYFESLKSSRNSYLPTFDFKTIFFGPPGKTKNAFMFFIIATCLYGYPCYLFKVLPYTMEFRTVHLLFGINTLIMWYALLKAHNMDPGFLSKNVDEYDQALRQVAFFDEWKQGQNPLTRLCHTCRLVRPLRAKHCRVTNRCVKHFDHYCPYIYNVVGYKNRHYFLLFLIGMWFTLLTGDYFVWYMYKHIGFDIILSVGGIIMALFTVVTSGLVFFTTYQAMTNITTNERLNYRRYDYLKDGNGSFSNPFDQGPVKNMQEFFHCKEPLETVPDLEHRGRVDTV